MFKKKLKSEVVMYEDDFSFHINRNRFLKARLHFFKKKIETGWVEDNFTFDVILHLTT